MLIEDFIFTSSQAKTVDQLFRLFEKKMADLGFNRVLLALINDHPRLKKEAEHGIVKNYPDDWVKHYLEQGYDKIDPVRNSVFIKPTAFTWDELIQQNNLKNNIKNKQNNLKNKQIKMFNEAHDAKLYHGINCFNSLTLPTAMLCVVQVVLFYIKT